MAAALSRLRCRLAATSSDIPAAAVPAALLPAPAASASAAALERRSHSSPTTLSSVAAGAPLCTADGVAALGCEPLELRGSCPAGSPQPGKGGTHAGTAAAAAADSAATLAVCVVIMRLTHARPCAMAVGVLRLSCKTHARVRYAAGPRFVPPIGVRQTAGLRRLATQFAKT